ncbi:MAG: ABC transporter permease [Deltaproteobacteria bacterium]|nr:ABC transporter permease [Deltaproteobacteria bacterium]
MQLTSMAWRNVWRNKRRSWVTIIAMALGLWVMIGYAGLVRGYLRQMERQILDVEVGDVQVHAPGFRDDPSLYRRIDDAAAIGERLGAAGFRASARLLGAGLAAAEDNSSGAQLIGVDVAKDAQVSAVHDAVDKGAWLDPKEPAGVVVGRYLARTLELAPGDELVLLSQASDGSMANDLYRVRGILGPVGGGVDRGGVFLTEAAFRELMGVPSGAHRIIVRAPEGMTLPAAKAGVVAAAGQAEVMTWRELLPVLAQMFDAVMGAMTMGFLVVFVAVGIVLLNTMLMAVFERIREFGVLKAIGFGPGAVLGLVLLESAVQTALGVGIGAGLSLPTVWYLQRYGLQMGPDEGITIAGVTTSRTWYAAPNAETWLLPIAVLLFVVGAAVIYPAVKAALIRPIEAIRHR